MELLPKSHELEEIRDIITCAICLDIFDNARLLSCSHTFCINCLRALCGEEAPGCDTTRSRCPQCRKYSIPDPSVIEKLPPHRLANQLADLVREYDEKLLGTEEEDEDDDEIYVGELLASSDSPEMKPKKSKRAKVALAMLKGVATVASLGLGGIYLGVQAAKKRRRKQALLAQNPLESFVCDSCRTTQRYSESEIRFKCGMCEQFNLCQVCAAVGLARVHRPDHLLLKLKFKQKRQLPPGCLLKYRKARDMSEEMDFSTTSHHKAYYHTPERLEWRDIKCGFCAQSPIVGTRYKCGMCEDYDLCESCEENSHEVHDRNHIFIVLRHRVKVNIISEPLIKALLY